MSDIVPDFEDEQTKYSLLMLEIDMGVQTVDLLTTLEIHEYHVLLFTDATVFTPKVDAPVVVVSALIRIAHNCVLPLDTSVTKNEDLLF